ncbi:C40 family peptidase [Lentzea tibetensis]|nr:FG-GAP-like repeat-containing protein [Lentzea tibetensis]
MKRRTAVLIGLAAALVTGVLGAPQAAAASTPDGPITRSEVLTRSQSWIDARVPYDQNRSYSNQYGTYRQDCSGFVSLAWHLGSSRWTGNLGEVMHDIPRADLKPGDALFRHDGSVQHVALFIGWSDVNKTRPIVREEYMSGRVAEQRVWDAGWAGGFLPKRYNKIVDDSTPPRPRGDHIGDVSGDGHADLVATKADGTLHYFANNINSSPEGRPFGNYDPIGVGFGPFTKLRSGDISGDGYADLIGIQGDGTLHYLPNNINSNPGHPYGNAENIGSGFEEFDNFVLGDVSGDGYADLLATRADGTLHYFPNNINSNRAHPFGPRFEIGTGFQFFTQLRAGDVSGDGYADLIGVQADGSLHYLPNNINSNPSHPYGNAENIGSGFQEFNNVVTADISGDGYADLIATKTDGTLHYFPNNLNSSPGRPYGLRYPIGSGFEIFNRIV